MKTTSGFKAYKTNRIEKELKYGLLFILIDISISKLSNHFLKTENVSIYNN